MSGHPDLRALLDGEMSAGAPRNELLAHLRDCAACRASFAASDPGRLFSLLAVEPIPEHVLERVTAGARAARAGRAVHAGGSRTWAWGSLAASLLLALALGSYLVAPRPAVQPAVELRRAPERAPTPMPATPAAGIPAGLVEVLDSPGDADVVEMSVGDVQIVMIFDEALEI